jgi:hypothetical protein
MNPEGTLLYINTYSTTTSIQIIGVMNIVTDTFTWYQCGSNFNTGMIFKVLPDGRIFQTIKRQTNQQNVQFQYFDLDPFVEHWTKYINDCTLAVCFIPSRPSNGYYNEADNTVYTAQMYGDPNQLLFFHIDLTTGDVIGKR